MTACLAPDDEPHVSRSRVAEVIGGPGDDFIIASVDLSKLKSKHACAPLGGSLGRVSPAEGQRRGDYLHPKHSAALILDRRPGIRLPREQTSAQFSESAETLKSIERPNIQILNRVAMRV